MVFGIFTHVSGVWEEEGKEEGFGELTDSVACPGRGRNVGEATKDEVSALGACPGRGRGVRHSVFKGEGRGGKEEGDKSSESAACPSRGRDIGRDVGFETCVKGLGVVETELDMVKRTELNVALNIFPTEEVLCLNQTVANAIAKRLDSSIFEQKKYFAFNSTCTFGEIQSCRITCLAPKWGILR